MHLSINDCGFDPHRLISSQEEANARLQSILDDKIMRFNPFSVDDETLINCTERARWLPFPSITQMVIFHFHDIRYISLPAPHDSLFFSIGNDPYELSVSVNTLATPLTYTATRRRLHHTINGKPVTNVECVARMQHQDFFVSHSLPCQNSRCISKALYRFTKLPDNPQLRAALIRRTMIQSKILMLQEIINHPYCLDRLCCPRDFIDYHSPISALIRHWQHISAVNA